MRVTSAKIMKRVAEVPLRTAASVVPSGDLEPLARALRGLSATVDGHIQSMQLADAIDAIILALSEVHIGAFTFHNIH